MLPAHVSISWRACPGSPAGPWGHPRSRGDGEPWERAPSGSASRTLGHPRRTYRWCPLHTWQRGCGSSAFEVTPGTPGLSPGQRRRRRCWPDLPASGRGGNSATESVSCSLGMLWAEPPKAERPQPSQSHFPETLVAGAAAGKGRPPGPGAPGSGRSQAGPRRRGGSCPI